jgi:hypothetical protein
VVEPINPAEIISYSHQLSSTTAQIFITDVTIVNQGAERLAPKPNVVYELAKDEQLGLFDRPVEHIEPIWIRSQYKVETKYAISSILPGILLIVGSANTYPQRKISNFKNRHIIASEWKRYPLSPGSHARDGWKLITGARSRLRDRLLRRRHRKSLPVKGYSLYAFPHRLLLVSLPRGQRLDASLQRALSVEADQMEGVGVDGELLQADKLDAH